MIIHEGLDDFKKLDNAIVTSGNFDGVHLGHRKIFDRLNTVATKKRGESVIVTLWPHPKHILHDKDSSSAFKLITTFEEKASILEKIGINHLIKIEFSSTFSTLSAYDFAKDILVDVIGTKHFIIGYDYRFGKGREGNIEYLNKHSQEFGFEIEEISKKEIDDLAISSTSIRESLRAGNIDKANRFLGRPYHLHGKVITGNQLGRKIGFPTANIKVDYDYKLIPADGAYAVKVFVDNTQYKGMLNIGMRPTIDSNNRVIEVNIFDFRRDIYDKDIEILFIKRFREEIQFDNVEALKNQLDLDKKEVIEILSTK